MKKHANIPVFIPHLGCPNQCVFCNQRSISGVEQFSANRLVEEIEAALSTVAEGVMVEIAFFGGSFTGIDRELMISLLKTAHGYIERGRVSAIRCSTRPDYIDEEIISILKEYGVRTVELGLQSVSDRVLAECKRGHTHADELRACRMIVESGLDLVGQMMIGLPGSTPESEVETAEFIANVGAVGARIYPTVVFRETELSDMTDCGEYSPLSLPDAIKRTAAAYRVFMKAGIDVIRIGLCSSENLSAIDSYRAGPNHPAIGELVENEIYYSLICEKLPSRESLLGKRLKIEVARGESSKAIGQKRANIARLCKKFGLCCVKVTESSALTPHEITVYITERENNVLKDT